MTRTSVVAVQVIPLAVASWLLCGCPTATAEEALGRLFYTPERRQQLDHQREMNTLEKQQVTADPTLTVDGIVTRSSGKRTAWINGIPQHEYETANGLTVTPRHGEPGKVVIRANDSPSARTRVGETVNRSSGESQDLLNGGQLRVHAGPKVAR
ncbi:MAG: hypothetical protein IPK02_04225 [Candidatus Accumulibacter sp.]|uniref:Uncharacterized protein n=1 Tax=Candidatus Accumulibacter affinis TaxID=2954384 RepID=A0A935T964_9PROT|nr:hypothetical protein [Candidatus Accumulibacter affinis]